MLVVGLEERIKGLDSGVGLSEGVAIEMDKGVEIEVEGATVTFSGGQEYVSAAQNEKIYLAPYTTKYLYFLLILTNSN